MASGAPIGQPLIGHTSYVWAVTTAQLDGRTVVISGGSDNTIRVWDLATGAPVGQPLDTTGAMVFSLAAAQLDGRSVIALGQIGTIRVVDIDQLRA